MLSSRTSRVNNMVWKSNCFSETKKTCSSVKTRRRVPGEKKTGHIPSFFCRAAGENGVVTTTHADITSETAEKGQILQISQISRGPKIKNYQTSQSELLNRP